MKKLLITGANGQLGHEAGLYFKNKFDCISLGSGGLDITSKISIETAFLMYKPDICLNCAAMTNVDTAETCDAETAFLINTDGVRMLSEVCALHGCILVHISTDYVFDGTKEGSYNEDDIPNPLNVYGRSKLDGETAVIKSGCKYFILRTSWLYGHFGNNFLKTILKLGKEHGKVSVVTDQRGNPTTTLELCRITEALLKTEAYGIYHASCRGVCTWNEFAKEIFHVYGLKVSVNNTTSSEFLRPATRPCNSGLSQSKLEQNTGYLPNSWQFCLREYYTWDVSK